MQATEKHATDLTLSPDSYLYLQSEAKSGAIHIFRGPTVVNQTGQDMPIKFESSQRRFKPCSLAEAVQQCPLVNEGDYAVIENPAEDGSFPTETSNPSKQLTRGRKINIPGPWSEALFPGQVCTVVPGHRLRSNQYAIAMVYEAEQAKKNWSETVVEEATGEDEGLTGSTGEGGPPTRPEAKGLPTPESFAVGTRIIIRGTDVSFFIPCTGVEVLTDEDGNYVREAVTLEQMEYCELIDESGKKEYPRGPDVVFPKPTQVFGTDSKKRRKFRPIELNTINGIHLKVTADFEDIDLEKPAGSDGQRQKRKYKEGEELFVTGNETAIYYPREELAIIEYGQGNKKHFSTAVPKGEARYVIDREKGAIRMVKGPEMLLADPRKDIPVRRVLSPEQCERWYPGNEEALAYNADLAQAMADSPSGRSGIVSEGDYRKRQAKAVRARGTRGTPAAAQYLSADEGFETLGAVADDYVPEDVGTQQGAAGKTIGRGTKYTEPRSLTLNTKYDGVPRIEVWPGTAVLIVGSESGERRVVEGPEVVLLEYDEKLGYVTLSTSKPKNTDRLFTTPYLQVQNNQVGDIINFESRDHVRGKVIISMRVSFEADSKDDRLKWFSTENYVKFLCDHVRSIIGGMAKRNSVADIKGNYIDLVRDAILGSKGRPASTSTRPAGRTDPLASSSGGSQQPQSEPLGDKRETSRPGLFFEENGMRVIEVEVLDLTLDDGTIGQMLDEAQLQVVRTNIELDEARKELEATREKEKIAQDTSRARHETQQTNLRFEKEIIGDQLSVQLARIEAEVNKITEELNTTVAREALTDKAAEAELARDKRQADQELAINTETQKLQIEELTAGTKAACDRFNAAKDGLFEVMTTLGRDEMAAKLAQGVTIERWLSGDSMASSISNLLSIAPTVKSFFEKAEAIQASDGKNRLSETAKSS